MEKKLSIAVLYKEINIVIAVLYKEATFDILTPSLNTKNNIIFSHALQRVPFYPFILRYKFLFRSNW